MVSNFIFEWLLFLRARPIIFSEMPTPQTLDVRFSTQYLANCPAPHPKSKMHLSFKSGSSFFKAGYSIKSLYVIPESRKFL